MIRKLTFAALAAALLGGCVSTGYQYRDGPGDYYYGRSASAYGAYGAYGAPYGRIGYGYPGGLYGGVGYGYGYGYPYSRYGSRYYGGYYPYGHPYYYSPYYYPRPIIVRPRHDPGHTTRPPGDHDHDRNKRPPWRDLADPDRADLRRRRSDTPQPSQPFVTGAVSPPPPRFVERPRTEPRLRGEEPEPRIRSRERDDAGTETP